LIEIEKLYKNCLPLPNPDVHEVIGEQINLAPSKVFFGSTLIVVVFLLVEPFPDIPYNNDGYTRTKYRAE
jgi:hypothetical protein